MTNPKLECFRDGAIQLLQEEIDVSQRAKISIGGLQISADSIVNDTVGTLLTKGPLGAAKSISTHIDEFAQQTTSFASQLTGTVKGSLKGILTDIENLGDSISKSPDSAMFGILSTMTSNPSLIYSLSKNAFNRSGRLASRRVSLSSDIINLINDISTVRSQVVPGGTILRSDPSESAKNALDLINNSISFLRLAVTAIGRVPITYENALEKMSDALDELKIGEGQFLLQEYLRLKADYADLVLQFSDIDLDIKDSNSVAKSAESDHENTKNGTRRIESLYVKEVLTRMIQLSREVKAVVDKNDDGLALEYYEAWASKLLSIYSLAYVAYDKDVQLNIDDADNADKISYQSSKASLEAIEPDLDAESIIVKMNDLKEMYLSFLFGLVPEEDMSSLEEEIKENLVTLSQSDQQLIDIDSGFNPTILEILSILEMTTKNSGLNRISEAIRDGSVGGLFGLLEESLGSTAAKVAGCLSGAITGVSNEETRSILLRANTRIQGVQRKRQLAGAIQQGNFDRASRSLDKNISEATSLTEQLKGLTL